VQKAVSLQFSLGRPVPLPCSILALPSRVVLSAGVFAPGLTIVQLGDLGSEATRLKSQCDALKTQRLALTTEVTSQTSELSAIRSEVERLTRERDALQLEYKTENEINEWYLRRELSAAAGAASATPMTGSTGGPPGTGVNGGSHDQLGAARRRAAMWEGKFRDLTRENVLEQRRWEGELEKEKAVAAGLRDRIGTLEERYRSVQAQLDSSEYQRGALFVELENTKDSARSEEMRLQGEWADMKQARDTAKSAKELLQRKLDEAVAAKDKVEAELHKRRSTHKR
jgi:predicted  nucleic acid-binding Zn-ribbon protein